MITHKGTQNIKTERLLLRKILPDDAEPVYRRREDLRKTFDRQSGFGQGFAESGYDPHRSCQSV